MNGRTLMKVRLESMIDGFNTKAYIQNLRVNSKAKRNIFDEEIGI